MDSLDLQFRVATTEELEANNDHCAICWEEMNTARYYFILWPLIQVYLLEVQLEIIYKGLINHYVKLQ